MKTYPKEDIKIGWEPDKCIHSGNCVRGLPKVFDPKGRPWITPKVQLEMKLLNRLPSVHQEL